MTDAGLDHLKDLPSLWWLMLEGTTVTDAGAGHLKRSLPRLTINIAFQTRAHMPVKVRLFIDALVERFQQNEYERHWTA